MKIELLMFEFHGSTDSAPESKDPGQAEKCESAGCIGTGQFSGSHGISCLLSCMREPRQGDESKANHKDRQESAAHAIKCREFRHENCRFDVEANKKFQRKAATDSAYLCLYK